MAEIKPERVLATAASLAKLRDKEDEAPLVIAQLGQSLDGRIATRTGESKYINGHDAIRHLHALRAHVDAVVIGVGTAIVDNPKLTVRYFDGKDPARVVIDPSGRLGADVGCIKDDTVARYVVRADDSTAASGLPQDVQSIFLEREGRFIPPAKIIESLFRLGLKRILIEGGAATVSAFIDAGVIDRLHLLVAPLLLGSGKSGLMLDPIEKLDDALRPNVDVYGLERGDVLFDCDLKSRRGKISNDLA